jgi:acyl-[acyl-carrier-protein]-phospholipid O-acyltransferase/long-chain-fatty-acid--[acyl-carrier-protein] ligase
MRAFLFFLVRTLFRVRLVGDPGAIALGGRVLIVSNHRSRLDTLVLAAFLPRDAVVIVPPKESQSPLMRWALRCIVHEVLDVRSAAALKPILKLLRAGRPVVLFPEGRSSRTNAVMKVYPVPALAALRSGAAIVPVRIACSQPGMGRSRRFPFLTRVFLFSSTTLHVLPARRIDSATAGSVRRRRVLATLRLTTIMQDAALQAHAFKPLFECFIDACAEHGRNTAIIEDGAGPHTYGQVLRASMALGRLMKRFTGDKEYVGVLLPNVPVTVEVVLGLSANGRVPVMFNYSGGASGVKVARSAAGVRTVITSRTFIERARLQPLLEALTGCVIVYLEDLRSQFRLADKLWLLIFALRFPRRAIAAQSGLDPAVVLLTSGSDGEPKGVVLSHRAVVANVMQIRTAIEFTPDDKILNPLPLYHAYSFTAGMVLPLITGTRLHLYISPLHYRAIPEIAYRNECTVLFGTGTFLSYYAAYANPIDFSRLRYVISGGEKLASEVARVWIEKFGLRIFEGYGCTECAPVISLATPSAYRGGSVGRFLPAIEYRVEPVSGIERGGVLHVRGPNLMLGHYLQDQPGVVEPCRSAIGPGWYDTGDIVEVDDDGFVIVHGRMRRFAKIAGEMVSLDHIEQVARAASPGHFHAAVLTMEEYGGESTVLFTTDPVLDRIMLQKAARALGSRDLAVARQIMRVRELPVLRSGKTDYASLGKTAQVQQPRKQGGALPDSASRVFQKERESVSQPSEIG